jgi:ABC-type antimicrobial peptide transport system permease subunit
MTGLMYAAALPGFVFEEVERDLPKPVAEDSSPGESEAALLEVLEATEKTATEFAAKPNSDPAVAEPSAGTPNPDESEVSPGAANDGTCTVFTTDTPLPDRPQRVLFAGVPSRRRRFSPFRSITGSMRYGRQTVRTSVRALRRNTMRSALTCLGIIIGIASVTALMEIGHGASVAMQTAIEQFGANLMWVFPTGASGNGVNLGAGTRVTLTPQDCDAINEQCTAVKAAVPNVAARLQLVRASRNWQPNSIYGTTPEYLEIGNWQIVEGDVFTSQDVLRGAQVCLIGQTLVHELFDGESPIGQTIRVRDTNLVVVGVLNGKGAALTGWDQDDIIIVPWTTMKYRLSGSMLTKVNQSAADGEEAVLKVNTLANIYPRVSSSPLPAPSAIQVADKPQLVRFENVDQILVAARSRDQIPEAIQQINDLLRERHRIGEGQANDFGVFDVTEFSNTVTATAGFMHNLLLSIAAISLVVGGIGIMNIMLVSTTERTREIGLRMAVGARAKDILRQFLIEAVALCLLGGVIGVLVGRCVSLVAEQFLHWPVAISVPAIIAALTVAGFVGIIFGFYPAWKASRLDPIEALRYE